MNLTSNEEIIALLKPLLAHPSVVKAHGESESKYQNISIQLDANYLGGDKVRWSIFSGGDYTGGTVFADTLEDCYKQIESFDPVLKKKAELAEKLAEVEKLKAELGGDV